MGLPTPKEAMIGAGKAFMFALVCQYTYEYTGYNTMIAESSLRYAKGSTLQKFTSRRHALLHQIYADIPNKTEEVKKRMAALTIAISHPNLVAKLVEYHKKLEVNHEPHPSYTSENNKNEIKVLEECPTDVLQLLPIITYEMDEDILQDILINGWDGYVPREKSLTRSLVNVNDYISKEKIIEVKKRVLAKLEKESDTSDIDINVNYGSVEELKQKIDDTRAYILKYEKIESNQSQL
jgi:hypothetical protein